MSKKLKILVVDDEKIIGELFEFTLNYSGHSTTYVKSAQEALEAIDREKFDIAFVDIVMPEKDGVQLLKEIKEKKKNLPVVMMTGYSIEDKKREAMEIGVVSCLNKPFEVDEIKDAIKRAIGKDV